MSKEAKTAVSSIGTREFRKMAEDLPFGVLESKADLQILFMNRHAMSLLGVATKKQIKTLTFDGLVAPKHRKRLLESVKALTKPGSTVVLFLPLLTVQGKTINSEFRLQAVGQKGAIRAYISDESMVSRTNAGFPFNDDILRVIMDNSHDAVAIIGDDFQLEFITDQGAALIGGTKEDLLGHSFHEFIGSETATLVRQHFEERRKGREVPDVYPIQITTRDGATKTIELRVSLAKSFDGSLKTVVHILDITDRLREQDALAAAEERYRVLVETMNDGLAIDDEQGRLVYANEAFCNMLGRTQKELVGKEWVRYTRDRGRDWLQSKIDERRVGKTARYELEWVRKGGEIIPTIISATPLHDKDEKFIGTFAVITEISTQKEAEDTIQFYLDLLTHDIANQLQVIITASGLLDVDLPRTYLVDAQNDILDAVERCNRLITKVKRAGEFRRLPTTRIELTSVLEEKINVLARVYGATVFLEDIEAPVYVRADTLLGELLWNLLENAARHNPKEKPRIWVSGSRHEGMYRLSISDDGPGISATRKKTIFNKRKHSGGVGLTLVAQMARKYGGAIEVEDRVKGKPSHGARFILSLHELGL